MFGMWICLLFTLLLPQNNGIISTKIPKKRSTNESFNVNIGAGYGFGLDEDTAVLPGSTTQINSTNPLSSLLKGEQVVIGKYPVQIPIFDSEMAESKIVPMDQKKVSNIEKNNNVMDMKEIQHILHNVGDHSEYSKIVQVVKVPAVYEIHLEKYEKNHQIAPKQYIQQINNLVSSNRPKKNNLIKVNNRENIIYGNKMKDFVKIDQWQHTHKIKKRQKKTARFPTKNTNLIPNSYPQNHQTYYKPEYTPYYPSTQQKHSVYSTLTRNIPFTSKRRFTDRSEVLNDNLVYGSNKEKVLNPDEINIPIQPGTTMVTLPKLEESKDRNFVEVSESKGCNKDYSQPVIIQPPEMKSESSNIENIYFTTLKPIEKQNRASDWSRYANMNKQHRRSGIRPVKYMLYINKIVTEGW